MTRAINFRQTEARARGDTTDYFHADAVLQHNGAIYGAFHCPTGKWYVGQTINTIAARAKSHWHSRRRATDHLHLTLADDPDPMCLIFIALEHIPKDEWVEPAPRQQGYRKRELTRFRAVATPGRGSA